MTWYDSRSGGKDGRWRSTLTTCMLMTYERNAACVAFRQVAPRPLLSNGWRTLLPRGPSCQQSAWYVHGGLRSRCDPPFGCTPPFAAANVAALAGSSPDRCQTWHTRKRKRQMNKREPERSEFGSEAEFAEAWEKWRQIRDQNNESVKRSRENSRAKKLEHDRLCEERERENSELTSQVQKLREQVTFLTKVLQTEHLSEEDEERVASLMGPLLEMDRQREEGQAGAEDGVAE